MHRTAYRTVTFLIACLLLGWISGCSRGSGEGADFPEPDANPGPGEPRFAAPPPGPNDGWEDSDLGREASPRASSPGAEEPADEAESFDAERAEPWPSTSAPRQEASGAGRGALRGSRRSRPSVQHPPHRPGLATHWGERRYSPVHEARFERAQSRPMAVSRFEYDDRKGALGRLPRGEWGSSELRVAGGALLVRMVRASGASFPALRDRDRLIVMGEPGERYSIVIENRSAERYEVVASVDGLDVLDGEEASPSKRGYLVSGYSSIEIDGFRRSESEVAAFRLGDVSGSYAARKGRARNVGVVGVAVFDERREFSRPVAEPSRWEREQYLRETADPFPGRFSRPPSY